VRFRMTGLSGPDCVLFTRNAAYRPDARDVGGPVWLRARVLTEDFPPYHADVFCVVTPWSTHGPQGRSASRPCLSGEDGMGRGSENLPLVRASRLARPKPPATGAAVGGLHGRSIVVRERKGSRPWCSPALDGLRGRAAARTGLRRALGASIRCATWHTFHARIVTQ
jgi:hypothetical protein